MCILLVLITYTIISVYIYIITWCSSVEECSHIECTCSEGALCSRLITWSVRVVSCPAWELEGQGLGLLRNYELFELYFFFVVKYWRLGEFWNCTHYYKELCFWHVAFKRFFPWAVRLTESWNLHKLTATAYGAVCVGNGRSRAVRLACSELGAVCRQCCVWNRTGNYATMLQNVLCSSVCVVTEGPFRVTGCSVRIIYFV